MISGKFFSTVLGEVTGYFDRHGLVSAFFPSLIFWGLSGCLVMGELYGWREWLQTIAKFPLGLQAIVFISFLAWVTFWTGLTLNFQSVLMRLYQGYWPSIETGVIGRIMTSRYRFYETEWHRLDDDDNLLREQQKRLQIALRQLKQPLEKAVGALPSPTGAIDSAAAKESRVTALETLEKSIDLSCKESLFQNQETMTEWIENLLTRSSQLQQQRQYWGKPLQRREAGQAAEPWEQYQQTVEALTKHLITQLKRLSVEVADNRQQLNRQQFLYLPSQASDVLPTKMGNVMRAASLYSQKRYNFDASLIWPRLQPHLPEGFANTLQAARTSLDLMVTLSAYCFIFGVPLSVWIAWRAQAGFLEFVPFGFVVLAALIRRWRIGALALVAGTISVGLRLAPGVSPLPWVKVEVLLTLLTGVLLASRLSYENAVQAALGYGEQLKAAFDLHRWKALEALHLKLPSSLKAEKQLWGEVCGLLYRGYADGLTHYQYQLPEGSKALALKKPSLTAEELDGRLQVAIAATPAMAFGGQLQTGDKITLCFEMQEGTAQTIREVVVVEVQAIDGAGGDGDPGEQHSYVMTVAMMPDEVDRWRRRLGEKAVVVLRR